MGMDMKYIWMDGKLVEKEKATVSVLSPSLHYGVATFEGIRCYDTPKGPAVFRLREHMERLVASASVLGCRQLPYTVEQLCEATKETLRANSLRECYIRPLIYFTANNLGLNLDNYSVNVSIAAWEWGAYLGEAALEQGVRAMVSSFTRHHPNVTMTKAKISGNYANSIMAKTDSIRMGFDEAIMLDPQGFVAECTGENLFLVRGGKIYTMPKATVLEGITRDAIITIMRDQGYQVIEETISRDQLYIADEMFVTGTAAECVAIREVDFRVIGTGKRGPVTLKIQKVFSEVIRGGGKYASQWLDYL